MSVFRFHSFRGKLFSSLLLASLLPLMICSMLMLELFRYRLTNDAMEKTSEYIESVLLAADGIYDKVISAKNAMKKNRPLLNALELGKDGDIYAYSALFKATENTRESARFDLYDLSGARLYSTHSSAMPQQLPTDWGVLYAAADGEKMAFVSCMDTYVSGGPLFQGASLLTDSQNTPKGFMVVSFFESDFGGIFKEKYGTHNELIVMDRFWRPVYCAHSEFAAAAVPVLRETMLSGQPVYDSIEDYSCEVFFYEPMGLYFALLQPQIFTRDTMRLLYVAEFFCVVVCIAVSVFTAFNLSRQLYRPISKLHSGMNEIVNNNLDVQVELDENDELGQLAQRFNGMVAALKSNQQALLENQKELDQAQIRMMQAQLNPHFLCNTLDTMKWISKINQVPQVALMSTDLAEILRFCISPDEFVALSHETRILERYIEIQRIRLSESFTFEMNIAHELENCRVPKMILQPIVENAILHGINGVENGKITVFAKRENGLLKISVSDNGRGLPEGMTGRYSDIHHEPNSRHLGLYNVDTILKKHYGGHAGLYLFDGENGHGAVITAILPIEEGAKC